MGGNNDVRLFLRQKRKQAHAHRPVKPGYERVQRRVRVRRAVEPAENAGHLRRHEMVAVAARLVKDGVDLLERVGDHHLVALCVFKNIRLQRAGRPKVPAARRRGENQNFQDESLLLSGF